MELDHRNINLRYKYHNSNLYYRQSTIYTYLNFSDWENYLLWVLSLWDINGLDSTPWYQNSVFWDIRLIMRLELFLMIDTINKMSVWVFHVLGLLNLRSRYSLCEFDKTILIVVNKLSKRMKNGKSKVNRYLRVFHLSFMTLYWGKIYGIVMLIGYDLLIISFFQ